MKTIVTPDIYGKQILHVVEVHGGSYRGSLEEYLRSLLPLVINSEGSEVSHDLIVRMIDQAFTTAPVEFDTAWLKNDKPPEYGADAELFVNKREKIDYITTRENKIISKYNLLIETILFQAADLHRMISRELKDPNKSFGVISPTGNSWYNFNVFDYFECAVAGFLSHIGPHTASAYEYCDWLELANLLELGRLYE